MINILSGDVSLETLNLSPWERSLLQMKQNSPVTYTYANPEALKFELSTRTKIVQAAKGLQESGAAFADFERSRCNERYWNLTPQGGFQLRSGVLPSDAIEDIYLSGRQYAFECATAIVIVMYKAILDSIDRNTFNAYFQNLLLYTWYYDNDLRFIQTRLPEAYPGDVLYFNNPDFSPETPGWRGENVILLGDGFYYGHGPGIRTAEGMLDILNRNRKPGSTTPAYLMDDVLYLDFEHIRQLQNGAARIGMRKYMLIS